MSLTDFTIIRRSMTSRMFSTVTTILTVAVAAGLMLVILSMREAGHKAFERGAGNMHLLVSGDSAALPAILNGIFYANPPQRALTWERYEQLAKSFPWEYAIPVQMGDSYRGLSTLATTPEFFTKFKPDVEFGWELHEGRFFENDFEIVVGAAAAKTTGLKVGESISLTHGAGSGAADAGHVHDEYTFTVVGILEPSGTPHDRAIITNLESAWIIHAHDRIEREGGHDDEDEHAHEEEDHDHAEEDHAHDEPHRVTRDDLTPEDRKITGIYLRLMTRPGSDASASLAPVFDQLRRDTSITVAQPAQQIGNLFRIVANVDQIFIGLAAVVMVSSGIAVMLALYNSMEQRRRQIAVLRVLGCSRGRVFGLVLTESAMLGLIGGLLGLVLCLVGAWMVAGIMKRELGLVIDPRLDPRWTLVIIVATVLLAALAGLVPAAMAYRTSVASNLKPLG
jgi:putative ABC transport system permease protein